jgi:hypothetical protein
MLSEYRMNVFAGGNHISNICRYFAAARLDFSTSENAKTEFEGNA